MTEFLGSLVAAARDILNDAVSSGDGGGDGSPFWDSTSSAAMTDLATTAFAAVTGSHNGTDTGTGSGGGADLGGGGGGGGGGSGTQPSEDGEFYLLLFVVLTLVSIKLWVKLLPKWLIKLWATYLIKVQTGKIPGLEEDYPEYDWEQRPPVVYRPTPAPPSDSSSSSAHYSSGPAEADTGFDLGHDTVNTTNLTGMDWGVGLVVNLNLTDQSEQQQQASYTGPTVGLLFTYPPLPANASEQDVPVMAPLIPAAIAGTADATTTTTTTPNATSASAGTASAAASVRQPQQIQPRRTTVNAADVARFLVRVEPKDVDYILCMGSLVSERHVLTAANCIDERALIHLESMYGTKTVSVSVGPQARHLRHGSGAGTAAFRRSALPRDDDDADHHPTTTRRAAEAAASAGRSSASDTVDVDLSAEDAAIFPGARDARQRRGAAMAARSPSASAAGSRRQPAKLIDDARGRMSRRNSAARRVDDPKTTTTTDNKKDSAVGVARNINTVGLLRLPRPFSAAAGALPIAMQLAATAAPRIGFRDAALAAWTYGSGRHARLAESADEAGAAATSGGEALLSVYQLDGHQCTMTTPDLIACRGMGADNPFCKAQGVGGLPVVEVDDGGRPTRLVGVQVSGDCRDGVFFALYLPEYRRFLLDNVE